MTRLSPARGCCSEGWGRAGALQGAGEKRGEGELLPFPQSFPTRKDPIELASRLTARRFVILLTLNTSQFNVAVFFII